MSTPPRRFLSGVPLEIDMRQCLWSIHQDRDWLRALVGAVPGHFESYHVVDHTAMLARAGITGNENVLDLGCGTGELALRASALTGGHVFGIDRDIEKVCIAYAQNWTRPGGPAANLHYAFGDITTMTLRDDTRLVFPVKFHVVMLSWVTHNLAGAQRQAMFRHLRPLLAPNARVVMDWTANSGALQNISAGGHIWDLESGVMWSLDWSYGRHSARAIEELTAVADECELEAVAESEQTGGRHAPWTDIREQIPPTLMAQVPVLTKVMQLLGNGRIMLPPTLVDFRASVNTFLQLHAAVQGSSSSPQMSVKQWVTQAMPPLHGSRNRPDPAQVSGAKWEELLKVYRETAAAAASWDDARQTWTPRVQTSVPRSYMALGTFRYRA